jgi:hypothetical protein
MALANSPIYNPTPIATAMQSPDGKFLQQYLQRELQKIGTALQQTTAETFVPISAAPSRPLAGMVVNADGVNWNPGSGAGPYAYVDGSWESMVAPPASPNYAWQNARNARTTTYSVVSGDAGKTIALGGLAFYTVTFGAPSGFPANFLCVVLNEDSGRGKTISLSGGTTFILPPLQTCFVYNQNNVWQILKNNKWKLPGTTDLGNLYTWYVDGTNGNDANDGLATTTGAFKTIQGAVDWISANVHANNQGILVSVADASAQTRQLFLRTVEGIYDFWPGISGILPLVIRGNLGFPVTWTYTGGNTTIDSLGVGGWRIEGFSFSNSGTAVFQSEVGGRLYVGANTYTGTNGTAIFLAIYDGKIEIVADQIVNSTAMSFFCYSFFNGLIIFTGNTITFGHNITFSYFMVCDALGIILAAANTYSGSGASGSTGTTFSVTNGGYLNTGGHITGTGGGANLVGNVYTATISGYVV